VLTSQAYWRRREAGEPGTGGRLDPLAVRRLNRLVHQAKATVVVSSMWRMAGLPWVRAELLAAGGTVSIAEQTPVLAGQTRGTEIAAWLGASRWPAAAFVILDGDDDMGDLRPHLVRTDSQVGVTDADVTRALRVLRMSRGGQPVD
jgi:hypothetical protein